MIVDTDELLDVQVEPALVDTTTKEKKKKKIQKVEKSVLAFMLERRIISEECIALEKGVTNFYRIEDSSAREGSLEQRQSALNDSYLQVFLLICLKILIMQNAVLKWAR